MSQTGNRKKSNWGWAERAGITPEKLRDLYREKTDKEIGDSFDVTETAVSWLRRRYGVKTVTPRQRRDQYREGMPSLDSLTPVVLAEMNIRMGQDQIAAVYGVKKPAISRLLRRWGIQALSKSIRATKIATFTEEQQDIIIGTLLGDGHLLERGVLMVRHGHDQIGYLQRMHALLTPHVLPIFYEEKELTSGQVCFAFGFRTVQHIWLQELRPIFYPQGEKVFPDAVLKNLSARSLAYWYFDDGHLDKGSNLPSLALGKISETEALAVARLVGCRFGLNCYLGSGSSSSCRILAFRAASTEVFFHLIRDYAPRDLTYKIPPKYRPVGFGVQQPLRTTLEPTVLPLSLLGQCAEWASATLAGQDQTVAELMAFWQSKGFPHQVPRPEELLALAHLAPDQVIQGGVIKNRQVGQATCHAFASHIWEATSYGNKHSPAALFGNPEMLQGLLRFLLLQGKIPAAANLRMGLRIWKRSGVYNFRPSAAKALTDRFCRPGGVVWDPCAGYGGRLLGVMLSQARPRYIACEPQVETYARLHDLMRWVDGYFPGTAGRVILHNLPAESFDLPEGVDLVLTSPPYWRREIYGQDETQAGIRYSTYDAWLKSFWGVVLRKAVIALRVGGWLVVNVDTFRLGTQTYDLVGDTQQLCAELGLTNPEVLRYAMPTMGNADNHETVLCFPKGEGVKPLPDLLVSAEEMSRCSQCGKGVPLVVLKEGLCFACLTPRGCRIYCKGCGEPFWAKRKGREFHDLNCYARWKRAQFRLHVPAKVVRQFTCQDCGQSWETVELGSFRYCPKCREIRNLNSRKKVCQYRHCGQGFTDTSEKNSMTFCCPEHRRREKCFRSGKAINLDYFKKPDPCIGLVSKRY